MPETMLASNLLEVGANRKCTGSGPNVNPAHCQNPATSAALDSSAFQPYPASQHLLRLGVLTGSAPEVTKSCVHVPDLSLHCLQSTNPERSEE